MSAEGGPRAVLIGPMAAGKTSVGRALARRWAVEFADLDDAIIERAGRSIPEIFAAGGEAAFRAAEAEALSAMLCAHRGVLSLGGGAPLAEGAATALRGHRVVLLEIDERTAAGRLHGGRGRPLLSGSDPLGRWREISSARLPRYRELAAVSVDARHGSADHVARLIEQALADQAHVDQAHVDQAENSSKESV